jgi:prepilin-type N-terminal cleavage/methylation domain-containing protein
MQWAVLTLTRLRPSRGQGGFTVVELSVSMSIMSIVLVSIVGLLTSQSTAFRRLDAIADTRESARLALLEIQGDLRSAEPLVELSTPAGYATEVRLAHRDFVTGAETAFRWRLDTQADELVREMLAPDGSVTAATYRIAGIVDSAPFRYFGQDGLELQTTGPGAASPSLLATCTIRIRVTLHAVGLKGRPAPVLADSDVQLRNRLPGSLYCGTPA